MLERPVSSSLVDCVADSAGVQYSGDVMSGATFGNYEIMALLGEGGMGSVYLARHTLIGRKVAIKILLPEYSHNQEVVWRFFNEAKAATAIKHPGIVEIYDFGVRDDGTAYIAMEYLEGETLKERLRRLGRLAEPQGIDIARQVANALAAAHSKGVVHRDLKPDNLFLVADPEIGERVKLLDFGIAKLTEQPDQGAIKTKTAALMGTPAYMSPEQCRGAGQVDHRTDLYSLGCIVFELMCSQPPFVDEGSGAVLAAHIYESPPSPRSLHPAISPQLESLILALLAKDRDARISSANELIDALNDWSSFTGNAVEPNLSQRRGPTTPPAARTTSSRARAVMSSPPTTLSGAGAAVSSPPIRSAREDSPSRRWGVAVVSALLVLGVSAWFLYPNGRVPETALGPPSQVRAIPVQPVAKEPASHGEAANSITIRINSKPPGANMYLQDSPGRSNSEQSKNHSIGKTPFKYQIEPGQGKLTFRIAKPGYRDHVIAVDANRDVTANVDLEEVEREDEERAIESPSPRPAAASSEQKRSSRAKRSQASSRAQNANKRPKTKSSRSKSTQSKRDEDLEGGGHVDPF